MDKKILFTTAYYDGELYDYWESTIYNRTARFSWIRRNPPGFTCIKLNIPQIDILEYPSFEEFKEKLKTNNYDIVGFSFYMNESSKVIEMIEYAKKSGIKIIWGGNYGVLTPEMNKYFDNYSFLSWSLHHFFIFAILLFIIANGELSLFVPILIFSSINI